jgi:ribosomal protein S18 acetylase RimI-like enzyme
MRASFGPNAKIMGVEPVPASGDYREIIESHEAYLVERKGALEGILILLPREDDLYIWGIATAPEVQGTGVGNRMMSAAVRRARELKLRYLRLRTGRRLADNVAWYRRHGFTIESVEDIGGRHLVHMVRDLQ